MRHYNEERMQAAWWLVMMAGAIAGGCSEPFTTFPNSGGGGGGGVAGAGGELATGGDGGSSSTTSTGGAAAVPVGWQDGFELTQNACVGPSYYAEPNAAACAACDCNGTAPSCNAPNCGCWPTPTPGCPALPSWVTQSACVTGPPPILNPVWRCTMSTSPTVAIAGSCESTGGALLEPEPWQQQFYACEGDRCISQAGDHACPDGWPERQLVFADVDDSRSCSTCDCAASSSCVGGTCTVYDGVGCSGTAVDVTAACTDTPALVSMQLSAPATPVIDCTPSGGAASGEVVGLEPFTFCCQAPQL